MSWALGWWRFAWLHARRAWAWDVGAVPLSARERARLAARGIEDETAARYLAWRRSLLLLAGVAGLFFAAGHALVALYFYNQAPEIWSGLGVMLQAVRYLALFALPAAALAAFACWARPRLSRRLVQGGWAVAFLAPVLISLVPPHRLFNLDELSVARRLAIAEGLGEALDLPVSLQAGAEDLHATLLHVFDLAGAVVYVVLLLPLVLSVVPGLLRACLRVKGLLPEAVLPGWTLLTVAPVYCFGGLLLLVVLNQVTGSAFVLLSVALFTAAPLLYVVWAPVFLRPVARAAAGRPFRLVRLAHGLLMVAAVVLLYADLSRREVNYDGQLLRLVGLWGDDVLLGPGELSQFYVEYLGRSWFMTVLAADLVLGMQVLVWGGTKGFAHTAQAAEYDAVMGRLSAAIGHGAAADGDGKALRQGAPAWFPRVTWRYDRWFSRKS